MSKMSPRWPVEVTDGSVTTGCLIVGDSEDEEEDEDEDDKENEDDNEYESEPDGYSE